MNKSEFHRVAKLLENSTQFLTGIEKVFVILKQYKLLLDNFDFWFVSQTFKNCFDINILAKKNLTLCKTRYDYYKNLKSKTELDFLWLEVFCALKNVLQDYIFELQHRRILLHENTVKDVLNQLKYQK